MIEEKKKYIELERENPLRAWRAEQRQSSRALVYPLSGQVRFEGNCTVERVCFRTSSNLATGYAAQYKVTATKPARSFYSASSMYHALVVNLFFSLTFLCYSLLPLYTFHRVCYITHLYFTEKVIVTNIISNKWYTGQYKEVLYLITEIFTKVGAGGLKLRMYLYSHPCIDARDGRI